MSLSQTPIKENINNSVLNGRSAMPQKGIHSNNDNRFSMNRVLYSKTINTETEKTNDVIKQKQFYGMNNRDASSVMERRKLLNQGHKNHLEGDLSYQSSKTINDVRQAQKRTRSGGAIVPAKKTHAYSNAPVFY